MSLPAEVNDHSFLAEELLIPNANKVDCSRANMVCSHVGQLLVLDEAEVPNVFSRFENQAGEFSSGIKRLKKKSKVVKVLSFNEYNHLVLLLNEDNVLEIREIKAAQNLTESFGYVNHNNESLFTVDSEIEADEIIQHNGMYDPNGNFQFGLNLLTVYLPYKGKTYEDPMVISETAAKKLSHSTVKIFDIVLNRNDVLVQPPVAVGEEIDELGIVARRRRINMASILDEFKNNTFNQLHPNDTLFFGHGVVTNIQVFCNTPEDLEYPYNNMLKEIEAEQREVYTKLLKYLNSKAVKKMVLDDNISFWKRKAEEYLNSEIKFSFDKREFEGILVRVEVTHSIPASVGSKLSGRYGDKGVISMILPDDQMPKTADGRYAEVARNSLGVVGRLNPAQLFEHELNYVAEEIQREAKLIKDKEKGIKQFSTNLMRMYEIACPELFTFANNLLESDKESWLEELFENGNMPVHQPPFFNNATIDMMIQLYTEFNIEKTKFEGIQEKLIFAKLYHIKLKHEPEKKFSARSTGMTSLLDIPYKSNDKYKKGNALFNNNPVKMGEQEYFNMALLGDPEAHSNFLKVYSASNEHRHLMLRDLLGNNVEDIDRFTEPDGNVASNSAQTVRAVFQGAGIELKPI